MKGMRQSTYRSLYINDPLSRLVREDEKSSQITNAVLADFRQRRQKEAVRGMADFLKLFKNREGE